MTNNDCGEVEVKYYLPVPKDRRDFTWVLYRFQERLELRERYLPFRCPECRKVDEIAAIHSGVDADVRVKARADYCLSSDGLILFSERLLQLCQTQGIGGFEPIALPGDPRYVIAFPTCLIKTDAARAGIELHGRVCSMCGRPHETTFLPTLTSLTLPSDPLTLFMSEIWSEKGSDRMCWFHASEKVVGIFKKEKVSGVEYRRPY